MQLPACTHACLISLAEYDNAWNATKAMRYCLCFLFEFVITHIHACVRVLTHMVKRRTNACQHIRKSMISYYGSHTTMLFKCSWCVMFFGRLPYSTFYYPGYPTCVACYFVNPHVFALSLYTTHYIMWMFCMLCHSYVFVIFISMLICMWTPRDFFGANSLSA